MYFSSVFPYVVLFIFLIRGLMLDGAMEGITYMFYPKVSTVFIIYVFDHVHVAERLCFICTDVIYEDLVLL